MDLEIKAEPASIRIDETGVARVGNTRVTLDIVIEDFNNGASAEEIVRSYSSLKLADVYGAISYYLREKPAVDAYLAERERQAEEVRREYEARLNQTGLREKLLARRKAQEQNGA